MKTQPLMFSGYTAQQKTGTGRQFVKTPPIKFGGREDTLAKGAMGLAVGMMMVIGLGPKVLPNYFSNYSVPLLEDVVEAKENGFITNDEFELCKKKPAIEDKCDCYENLKNTGDQRQRDNDKPTTAKTPG